MIIHRTHVSADELFALPADGFRYRLIEGELRQMAPAGEEHGRTISPIAYYLYGHVKSNKLGATYGAETGFILARDPDTVLAPDVAFVSAARASELRAHRGYAPGAPDLVVEVVSPGDSAHEVEEKVLLWLNAGVKMVILVHPRTRTVTVYRSREQIRILDEHDTLSGEEVVPGWQLPIHLIFEQT